MNAKQVGEQNLTEATQVSQEPKNVSDIVIVR